MTERRAGAERKEKAPPKWGLVTTFVARNVQQHCDTAMTFPPSWAATALLQGVPLDLRSRAALRRPSKPSP
jgi:hypothetical protein